jgi:hypothetical protein
MAVPGQKEGDMFFYRLLDEFWAIIAALGR